MFGSFIIIGKHYLLPLVNYLFCLAWLCRLDEVSHVGEISECQNYVKTYFSPMYVCICDTVQGYPYMFVPCLNLTPEA